MDVWLILSPCSIALESHVKVMGTTEMLPPVTNLRSSRFLNKFSLSVPQKM